MIRSIITLCLSIVFFSAAAHQADHSSTVLAEQDNNSWILQIKASLTAFQFEVKKNYGESAYATPEEFQELVLKHVQKHISITLDNSIPIILEDGIVNLGHETSVAFRVQGMMENFKEIDFTNSSFKDIHKNQSALIILKKGLKQTQFVLNNKNEHTSHLTIKDAQFTKKNPSINIAQASTNTPIWLAIASLLGLLFFMKLKQRITIS